MIKRIADSIRVRADIFIFTYFSGKYNNEEQYYKLRKQFNETNDQHKRAVLFVYLNRHGYNGLCRYNLKGGYNVPFGRYKAPYFPEKEMLVFHEKAQNAEITIDIIIVLIMIVF